MPDERLGASFSIDTTALKAGLAQANRLIRESESEFKAAAAGMDDWSDSQEGLEARIKHLNNAQDLQKKKVEALKKQYEEAGYASDDLSVAAVKLRTDINKEQEALNKTEKELKQQAEALKNLDKETKDTDKSTEKLSKTFEGLKKAGKVAVGAIAGVAGACVGAVTAFLSLGESTKETQTEMAKLSGAFESAKLGGDAAQTAIYDLYGVLGDMGRSTEASVLLAKMSKDEDALQANTRILTGVFAEFGDSIPTEGLAEGMQATAEMGEVQGVLADALEWQGINLDECNAKLGAMSSSEERAAFIQKTLTDLYGDSADAYRDNNKALIEANEAQLSMEQTLAELGAVALPIMTQLKELATDLLRAISPFVKVIGEGLTDALNGADGASEKLADGLSGLITTILDKIVDMLPFVIKTILAVIPRLLQALSEQLPAINAVIVELLPQLVKTILEQLPTILQTVIDVVTQVTNALSEMLPTLIPIIINAILLLVETVLDNIDQVIDAGIAIMLGLIDGILEALPLLIDKIPVIIGKLIKAIITNEPKLEASGIKLLLAVGSGLIKAVPQLLFKIPEIIMAIVNAFIEGIPEVVKVGEDLVKGLWAGIQDMAGWISEKIKGFGENILGGIKKFFGIASPSKVMADQVGKNLALGIGKGFEKNIGNVNADIQKSMDIEGGSVNVKTTGGQNTASGQTVNVYQTNNYSQAHSRLELYKSKQATANAVKLALGGA